MLDITKPVQTMNGRPVKIIYTEEQGYLGFPYLGYIGDRVSLDRWSPSGNIMNGSSSLNLVNVPPPAEPPEEKEEKMIDFTKPLRTKSGQKVEIISSKGRFPGFPYLGYIGDDSILTFWALNGQAAGCKYIDGLENVPSYHMEKRWVNVYTGYNQIYKTKESADEACKVDKCIACVEIDYPVAGEE